MTASKTDWLDVAIHNYAEQNDNLRYQVVRKEREIESGREKRFLLRRPDGNGGWIYDMNGIQRLPYLLTEVQAASLVLIVEGEQCVEAVMALGLPKGMAVTTNSEGAGKFQPELVPHFTGVQAVLCPDNDHPGRKHVAMVADMLMPVAASVAVLELQGLREKGDIKDWIDAGGTRVQLMKLIRSVKPLDAAALSALRQKWGLADDDGEVARALARVDALPPDLELQDLETKLRPIFEDLGQDPLQRALVREACIGKLSSQVSAPARIVDAAMQVYSTANLQTGANGTIAVHDVEPWPEPVDGESLLDELIETLRLYVVLTMTQLRAIALWIILTYTIDAADCCPYLDITSPEKRCGKTRLLSVIAALVAKPLPVSNITPAAVFRTIEAVKPTLLIDEADTFLSKNDELRGILNSGHTRDTAFVIRLVGENHEPKQFSTWCPKAIALIGHAPQTIEDRSIIIPLRRKTATEEVDRWNRNAAKTLEDLRRKCARWAADNLARLQTIDPEIPDLDSDRAEDNWRPLLAIAEAIGGDCVNRARAAAGRLSGGMQEDESPGVLLLGDLREMFLTKRVDRLPSTTIVASLAQLEQRPWPEWKSGKPITTRQLAILLNPFGVHPGTIRMPAGDTPKGYQLADFDDAFSRYLPAPTATTPHE